MDLTQLFCDIDDFFPVKHNGDRPNVPALNSGNTLLIFKKLSNSVPRTLKEGE